MTCSNTSLTHVSDLQTWRRVWQAGFFILFLIAPPLDLFRIDITQAHVIIFGQVWSLGIIKLMLGESTGEQAVIDIILRGLIPLAICVGAFGWIAWR